MSTEQLIVVENKKVTEALTNPVAMQELFAEIRAIIDEYKLDITTPKGRKEVASVAYKVARTKVTIDDCGKEMVASAKAKIAAIDSARKTVRDTLDAWRDEVRKPLTEWEEHRKAASDAIGECERIEAMAGIRDLKAIEKNLAAIEHFRAAEYPDDVRKLVEIAADAAYTAMDNARAETEKAEAEKAELEKLRKQEQDRINREAQAQRDQEIAAKAAAEADDKARRAVEAAQEAQRIAEQRAEQAKADAEAELERDAQAAAEAERKRALDQAHRAQIMNAVYRCFVGAGLASEEAIKVTRLIATGSIEHVRMEF